eukprot:jgi/Botrbrau1/23640/Bobra.55_2s0027.1
MAINVPMVVSTYAVALLSLAGVMLYLFRHILAPSRTSPAEESAGHEQQTSAGDVEKQGPEGRAGGGGANAVSLEWRGVGYKAKHHGRWKQILEGCSGQALPGHMTALMGPSGAGKSTLLDILAMRLQPTSGTVLANGRPRTAGFRSVSAYVPQEAHFVPTLTVGETLMLHARLRLPRYRGRNYKLLIQDTLNSMGLLKAEHTQVGGELPGGLYLRGISGGEVRRLHIACGIVAAPSIIFLDEPTSGLDSHAALVLMEHLKGLALGGRTLLCSIHQPRHHIWEMFDSMALISEGYLIYFGPPTQAVPWFREEHGLEFDAHTCGASSDWLLDQVSVHFYHSSSRKQQGFRSVSDLQRAAAALAARGPHLAKISGPEPAGVDSGSRKAEDGPTGLPFASDRAPEGRGIDAQLGKGQHRYPTSLFNQLLVLCWRTLLQYLRNPADVALRIFIFTMVGTFMGLIFSNTIGKGGYIDIMALYGMFFLSLMVLLLHPMTIITLFASDRKQFLVDLPCHIYGPVAWFVAQNLVAAPFLLFSSLVLQLLSYGLVGLTASTRAIAWYLVTGSLLNLIGNQVALLSVHLTSNQDAAMLLTIVYNIISLLLAGYFVRVSRLPAFFRWLSYATPFRYAFGLVATEQLRGTIYTNLLVSYSLIWSPGAYLAGLAAIYVVFLAANLAILFVLRALRSLH